jgi:hypothetical protein
MVGAIFSLLCCFTFTMYTLDTETYMVHADDDDGVNASAVYYWGQPNAEFDWVRRTTFGRPASLTKLLSQPFSFTLLTHHPVSSLSVPPHPPHSPSSHNSASPTTRPNASSSSPSPSTLRQV